MVKKTISRFCKRVYLTPLYYSYGNAAEEILWASARAKITKDCLVIIPPASQTQILSYRICNRELFALQVNKIGIKCSKARYLIINFIFFASRALSLIIKKFFRIVVKEKYLFPLIGKDYFWPRIRQYNNYYENAKSDQILCAIHEPLEVDFNKDQKLRIGASIDKLLGLKNKKYVCLHVRDSGFHNDLTKRSYRNADITTYKSAILHLIENGFTVVRLGDPSMPKLNLNNQGYIEYSHSDFKSELLDLALIKNCEFYIGMQSGPLDIALMFQKPALILNMYEWINGYPLKINDRGLLKNISINGDGQYLRLEEVFRLPFKYTNIMLKLKSSEIQFTDNSEQQILYAIMDYVYNFTNKTLDMPNKKLLNNKKIFIETSKQNIINIINNDRDIFYPDEYELTRMIYKNLACKGFYYEG